MMITLLNQNVDRLLALVRAHLGINKNWYII